MPNIIRLIISCILLLFISKQSYGQNLGSERVHKLRQTVVRLSIDGSSATGTGFLADASGHILTCWHVIEPSIVLQPNQDPIFNKIWAHFTNGDKEELRITRHTINSDLQNSIARDYCILEIVNKKREDYPFLQLGQFEQGKDGDNIVTCGYPLGIDQQIITKGMISTKFMQPVALLQNGKDTLKRDVAYLDLSMTSGNSGGPILLLGIDPKDDKVIGIATFILSPYGQAAAELKKTSIGGGNDIELLGVSSAKLHEVVLGAVSIMSLGVGGCISIDYLTGASK